MVVFARVCVYVYVYVCVCVCARLVCERMQVTACSYYEQCRWERGWGRGRRASVTQSVKHDMSLCEGLFKYALCEHGFCLCVCDFECEGQCSKLNS